MNKIIINEKFKKAHSKVNLVIFIKIIYGNNTILRYNIWYNIMRYNF